jgi:hypothetical protein
VFFEFDSALREDNRSLTVEHLQDAGKQFAFDLGSGRAFL